MKLQWLGHSCFKITTNDGTVLVTDPFDASVGYPMPDTGADVVLSSHGHFDHNCFDAISGEFEIVNTVGVHRFGTCTITGVRSFHDDAQGAKRGENILFAVEADGMKLVHLGDLGHMPVTDEQIAALSGADVMLIPIGGTFTITTDEAVRIIERFAPRIAIAMHFKNRYCGFNITDEREFVRLTHAKALPNAIEIAKDAPKGCFIMDI